ncbi:hypothetical protein QWJ26_39580 [Streptomyces sp. CSDS2]|uniref:hypothetical protein n=1 Tax=Streptomyces sp. CSDS2 TaxID=3055051 RepID=UPI0025AEEEC2|nr:hypothetical protein [Streptomyces sp. CSDS2]MDN3265794.1 hypothetical protein [Streptomyces sp. CSDS2]
MVDSASFFNSSNYHITNGNKFNLLHTTDNTLHWKGYIGNYATYSVLPIQFKSGLDSTSLQWGNQENYHAFYQDQLCVIDTTRNNCITWSGRIGDHPNYAKLPDSYKQGVDATAFLNGDNYDIFKGGRVCRLNPNKGYTRTGEWPIKDCSTYANLPTDPGYEFDRGIDAACCLDWANYHLFRDDKLVVINIRQNNKVVHKGPISEYPTYRALDWNVTS